MRSAAPADLQGLRSQGRRLGCIPWVWGAPGGGHWRREWAAGTGVCVAHGTGRRWRASCPGPGAWVPSLLGSVLQAPCAPAVDSLPPSMAPRCGQHPRSWPLPSVPLSCLWVSTPAIAARAESLPTGPALLSLPLVYLEACLAASSWPGFAGVQLLGPPQAKWGHHRMHRALQCPCAHFADGETED